MANKGFTRNAPEPTTVRIVHSPPTLQKKKKVISDDKTVQKKKN